MEDQSNEAVDAGIYEALRIVKPSLADEVLTAKTRFNTLNLQSIDMMTVVFEMEERFGVSIVDQQLDTFRTVEEARETVQKLLHAKTSQPSV